MKAIYAGSFDPLTYGHLDIISRASKMCSQLFVVIAQNPDKEYLLSAHQRLKCLQREITQSHVTCLIHDGLVSDCAKRLQVNTLIRGVRDAGDVITEFEFARVHYLADNLETIWLPATSDRVIISSSLIKDIARHGGDISTFVPRYTVKIITDNLKISGTEGNKN